MVIKTTILIVLILVIRFETKKGLNTGCENKSGSGCFFGWVTTCLLQMCILSTRLSVIWTELGLFTTINYVVNYLLASYTYNIWGGVSSCKHIISLRCVKLKIINRICSSREEGKQYTRITEGIFWGMHNKCK